MIFGMHAVSAAGAADHWAHVRSFGTGLSLPVYRQKGAGEADVPYLELLILFSFIVFVWEFYLDVRQYRALQRKDIPSALTERIAELDSRATASGSAPPEQASRSKDDPSPPAATSLLDRLTSKFEAARKYSIDKAHLGFVETAFSQTENTTLLLLGSMPWFWDISVELAGRWLGNRENEYVVSLVLLGLNMVLEQVVHLPFSLWAVFVVEERHGFNKQSLGNFFLDKLKGLALSALLGGPMTLAVLYVIKAGGRSFFLYLYLLVLAFQLLLLTIYPTVIAPLFNKYEPLPEDSELKIQIDALASRVKFPLTKVFVVDGSRRSAHSNAYFYGFFKNKRIVLFDTLIAQVGPHLPTPPRKVEGRKVALPHP
jgi:STE24 endopeptidase